LIEIIVRSSAVLLETMRRKGIAGMHGLTEDERAFIERRLAQERLAMAEATRVVRCRHEQFVASYEMRLGLQKRR
jgi:hypothetical protein